VKAEIDLASWPVLQSSIPAKLGKIDTGELLQSFNMGSHDSRRAAKKRALR